MHTSMPRSVSSAQHTIGNQRTPTFDGPAALHSTVVVGAGCQLDDAGQAAGDTSLVSAIFTCASPL